MTQTKRDKQLFELHFKRQNPIKNWKFILKYENQTNDKTNRHWFKVKMQLAKVTYNLKQNQLKNEKLTAIT